MLVATTLLLSVEVQANGIVPITNLFTSGNWLPAGVLTGLIVLTEALLLWRWLKPLSFRMSLGLATLINLASSTLGSLLAWWVLTGQMAWVRAELYFPMFILTLIVETPLLGRLLLRHGVAWSRSIKLSLGLNTISYALVFVGQYGLIFVFLGYGDLADKRAMEAWNDQALLEGQSGYIYTIQSDRTDSGRVFGIDRFDVALQRHDRLALGPEGLYPTAWDVRGHLAAYIKHWQDRRLVVRDLEQSVELAEIPGNLKAVRVAPGLARLAVLERVREVHAPKDQHSSFALGDACRVKIYDSASGEFLAESPRLALDLGMTWLDDTRLVFASLRDAALLDERDKERLGTTYGRGYAEAGQFPIDLFVFNLEAGEVHTLVEGIYPFYLPANQTLLFMREQGLFDANTLWQVPLSGGQPQKLLEGVSGSSLAASSNGDRILFLVPRNNPLVSGEFLVLADPADAERRLIVDAASSYGFRWVAQ